MPIQCLKRPLAPNADGCSMFLDEVMARQKEYRALILSLKHAHPQIKIFDPTPSLCDTLACYVRKDERFIYRDDHHLSLYGSSLVAKQFLPWLRALDLEDHAGQV